MSLVDRVAARLAALRDGLPVDALHTASAGVDDVVRDVGALADGSDNPHLVAAYTAFERARAAIDDALMALGALVGHLADYQRALGISDVRTPAGYTPPVTTAPVRTTTSDQDVVACQLLAELPVRGPRDKTRALWIDEDGEKHSLISGEHDSWYVEAKQRAVAAGIVPAGVTLVIASHVEVKFAMRMRAHNVRRATLVVNKVPCPGEFGCDGLLRRFVPDGGELTVYGPDGFRHTYRGKRAGA